MRRAAAALLLAALAPMACAPVAPPPEVPEGSWLLPGTSWRLTDLGGAPFPARVTATLTEDGRIAGQAPCNRFTAEYRGRWPDLSFEVGGVTRMTCPDQQAETAFFAELARVSHAALDADGLVLTGPDGALMRFVRD